MTKTAVGMGRAVLEDQWHTLRSFATFDRALRLADFLTWINQLIAQSLMVPLAVIMFQELADSRAK